MTHLGKYTSTIISKGISAGQSQSYRGLVRISPNADNENFSRLLLMGNNCGAHTFPYIESKKSICKIEHEATTVKLVKIKFSIAINVEFQPRRQSL
jgi:Fe-S cluster assembly protein SufB